MVSRTIVLIAIIAALAAVAVAQPSSCPACDSSCTSKAGNFTESLTCSSPPCQLIAFSTPDRGMSLSFASTSLPTGTYNGGVSLSGGRATIGTSGASYACFQLPTVPLNVNFTCYGDIACTIQYKVVGADNGVAEAPKGSAAFAAVSMAFVFLAAIVAVFGM